MLEKCHNSSARIIRELYAWIEKSRALIAQTPELIINSLLDNAWYLVNLGVGPRITVNYVLEPRWNK
jgi:hypothetical protein